MKQSIVIAGEGGQGIQLIAQILAQAARLEGNFSTYIPNFGVEQRGGVSVAFVQISDHPISYPKFLHADLLVVLAPRAVKRTQDYIGPDTKYFYDSSVVPEYLVSKSNNYVHKMSPQRLYHGQIAAEILKVPATKIAREKFTPRVFNMIILGAITETVRGLTKGMVKKAISQELAEKFEKDPNLEKLNMRAFMLGTQLANQLKSKILKAQTKKQLKELVFRGRGGKFIQYPYLCKSCGLCIVQCPQKALSWSDNIGTYGLPVPKPDITKCIFCGICERICPDSAIKIEARKKRN